MTASARPKLRTETKRPPQTKRPRRANVERSAAMRQQVLEAVIRGLREQGFNALTNARVVELAGISSGAMMHHFPSRQALLVAAVNYAYAQTQAYRVEQLDRLPEGMPRFRALIDLAWATARRPEGIAANEIRLGARSDPATADAVRPAITALANDYGRFVGRHVRAAGLVPDREIQGLSATTAMAVRALAIDRFTYPNPVMVENVLFTLRQTRERIIGRQLGQHMMIDPALPNISLDDPAR